MHYVTMKLKYLGLIMYDGNEMFSKMQQFS